MGPRENALLAHDILNSDEVQYGVYKVSGFGVVTIDRKRGKSFIGNKLSHTRKPSAYQGKTKEVNVNFILNFMSMYQYIK